MPAPHSTVTAKHANMMMKIKIANKHSKFGKVVQDQALINTVALLTRKDFVDGMSKQYDARK